MGHIELVDQVATMIDVVLRCEGTKKTLVPDVILKEMMPRIIVPPWLVAVYPR